MSIDTLTEDGAPVTLNAPVISGDGVFAPVGFAAMGGSPNELLVLWASNSSLAGTTYTDTGALIYTQEIESGVPYMAPTSLATVTADGVAMTFSYATNPGDAGTHRDYLMIVHANGKNSAAPAVLSPSGATTPATVTTALDGVHLSWSDISQSGSAYQETPVMQDWTQYTTPISAPVAGYYPYADTSLNGFTFQIKDNQAQMLDGSGAVTPPGEPAHAVTQVVTAGLSNGEAAVAWIDSGSVYLSMYDSATHSIGDRTQLDFGNARDLHLVTLPDGGFAVSWYDAFNQNGTDYKGELFDNAGNGGGRLTLTGQFGAIDSQGDLYTVGVSNAGNEIIQRYSLNGSAPPPPPPGDTVHTSDSPYAAPGGVTTIYLTGSDQVVTANNAGDIIWSDNTVNHLTGGSGADVFHLGRGGDIVTGGAGNDTFAYGEVPWAGGHVTDFALGDTLDLTGLISTTHETAGGNPFADGYARITDDGMGDAQVWARYGNSGSTGWWLVTTLDGISSSDLQTSGDLVTLSAGGSGSVTTASSDYVAAANVTSITLTGSQQKIDASATNGVTINSDNTANTLIGGGGDDTFHLGRGGDVATGGAGADAFAYAETPWAGGHITDFSGGEGDRIDVSGLLARSHYSGSDPFADGYLRYTTASDGSAQLWSDVHQPGNDGWWLVATLDGVSTSSLHYSGGLIT